MRKIKLYIATSLDNYIARPNGRVDWLETFHNPEGSDYGYADFLATIDTNLMGNNTYKEILGFGIPFPYPNKVNYVFTRQANPTPTEFVTFVNSDIIPFVENLKQQPGKDIWLIGGGQLNTVLLNARLIDEMIISVLQIVIGEGIPLFASGAREQVFDLVKPQSFASGLVQLTYTKK